MEAPRRITLLFALALALLLAPVAGAQEIDRAGESAMLARINAMRAAQQLAPLTRHEGLDAAARVHSEDMAANRMLAHVSPRTGNPGDRLRAASVDAQRIAENIARRASTLEAHQSILESDAHRGQLLDSQMTHIGLAAVSGVDGVYVTQLIARIESELPPDPAAALPPPAVEEVASPPAPAAVPAPEPQVAPRGEADPIAALAAQALAAADAQADEEAAPAEAEPEAGTVYAPTPPPQRPAPAATTVVAPTLRLPSNHRGVAGYWVRHGGRWWYFPVPASAVPGQVLQSDPSVVGPPPQGGRRLQARPVTAAPPRTTTASRVYVRSGTGSGPAYYYTPSTSYVSR